LRAQARDSHSRQILSHIPLETNQKNDVRNQEYPSKFQLPAAAAADRATRAPEEFMSTIKTAREQLELTATAINEAIEELRTIITPQPRSPTIQTMTITWYR